MAKLTLRAECSSCLFSHSTSSQSPLSSPRRRRLLRFPPKNNLELRVICSIQERENVRETKRVNGLPVDKVQRAGSGSGSDSEGELSQESGSGEVGFDWDWPPWKNIPQRYKLIGTTSLAFVICNMDKVNLSIAIIPMSHQFGWSSSEAGLVQSSFFWGYALSQLPGGWLAKIFSGRKVLQFGVLTWSLATGLVPLVAGFTPGLVLSRILVGIGEGVSPSAATDLIARHDNTFGRAFTGCSICLWWSECRKCCRVSSGSSPYPKSGVGICILHIFLFGDCLFLEGQASWVGESIPRSQSTDVKKTWSTEELGDSLKDVPWKAFFQSPAVWAMIYAHFCGSWGHYTCLAWLPTYFSEELNLNLTEAAWVSILPPLASIFVTSIASQFADSLISTGVQTTTVRKVCQTIAFLSPAACMTLSSLDLGLPHWEVVGILTGGLALSSFALSGLYCTHQDMSPEYASILLCAGSLEDAMERPIFGITNTVGAVPGIIGVALTGFLLDSTHSWSISLFIPSIFFYLTGTVVWLVFASTMPTCKQGELRMRPGSVEGNSDLGRGGIVQVDQ
ncbi:hypothetical protein DVH24_017708 [Malus domestica]|uniref:Major facilitator superfamily (MFS) profile domain-containing protein n=1 Tax=Malus domestica TaxID=3750 RepID=A0A498KE61_MALDO|nr:hypothetical protein DVH24_017708 [Malus domestica]